MFEEDENLANILERGNSGRAQVETRAQRELDSCQSPAEEKIEWPYMRCAKGHQERA